MASGDNHSAQSAPAAMAVATVGHVESVAVDEKNNVVYMASIGEQLTPMEKDGDGAILAADLKESGALEMRKMIKGGKLDAPKGLTLHDGKLYATDVDRVVSIDPRKGSVEVVADLSSEGAKFLNDTVWADGVLYVSATDLNKIYAVNPQKKTYSELKTSEPVKGPNGLVWDRDEKILYVCEYCTDADGKPAGRLLRCNPKTGEVKSLSSYKGELDGLALYRGDLYFSDWAAKDRPGAVSKLNLESGDISPVTTQTMNGPADFCITLDGIIIVPAMVDKKVWVQDTKPASEREPKKPQT